MHGKSKMSIMGNEEKRKGRWMKDYKRQCTVDENEITLEEISYIMKNQSNTGTLNERKKGKNAFDVALEGSKIYLEAQHFVEEE